MKRLDGRADITFCGTTESCARFTDPATASYSCAHREMKNSQRDTLGMAADYAIYATN